MTLVNRDRERLLHAITFFLEKTRYCFKLKLFKLLYFSDVRHFQSTGRAMTGLDFFAWPMGPVPRDLNQEIDDRAPSFTDTIKVIALKDLEPESGSTAIQMRSTLKFDETLFSPRELKIMNEIAEIYKEVGSKDISLISHEPGGPWHRVYAIEKRKQALIPMIYALKDMKKSKVSKEYAEDVATVQSKMKKAFGR